MLKRVFFCHEIPRFAIRQNVYFRNAGHGILEPAAGSASVRQRALVEREESHSYLDVAA